MAEATAKPGYGSPEHLAALQRGIALSALGVAGVTGRGTIVDRREVPDAQPIPANSMMGVPKPRKLGPKLAAGERGPNTVFLHDGELVEFEMGSDPEKGTDCGTRGINHIMRREGPMITRCLSPGCDARC